MFAHPVEQLPRVPVLCFWEITEACNLRCIHCECAAGRAAADELTTSEALALCEQMAALGCQSVNLTGGEPLVRKDWPVIAQRLVDLGLTVTVISNGILVDEAMIARLEAVGVTGLSLSLDGDREVHDRIRVTPRRGAGSSYDAAVSAIERSVASSLKTAVITQIHRGNIADLPRLYEQMVGLGIDVWQVQICMPLGRLLELRDEYLLDPRSLPELQRQLAAFVADGRLPLAIADNIGYYGRHEPALRGSLRQTATFWTGCMAGCRVLAFRANGDVKGCPSHPTEFVVGNLRDESLAIIWQDAARFSYNTAWQEDLLAGECAECPHRRLCRAGCTTMAYAVTGTIYDNPFCLQRADEPSSRGGGS